MATEWRSLPNSFAVVAVLALSAWVFTQLGREGTGYVLMLLLPLALATYLLAKTSQDVLSLTRDAMYVVQENSPDKPIFPKNTVARMNQLTAQGVTLSLHLVIMIFVAVGTHTTPDEFMLIVVVGVAASFVSWVIKNYIKQEKRLGNLPL
mgnify:CR=1 FL=1